MVKSRMAVVAALLLSVHYIDLDSAWLPRSVWLPVLESLLLALTIRATLWLGGWRGGVGEPGSYPPR